MELDEIYEPVKDYLALTEQRFALLLDGFSDPEAREVLEHFLSNPGKRIRPALLYFSAFAANPAAASGNLKSALLDAGTAFELVHSASLVHDDIIDESPLRRGRPTVNGRFGNSAAVLAGDILYAAAFRLMAVDVAMFHVILDVTREMCIGEIFQLRSGKLDEEAYLKIIGSKTARLMAACCEIGGRIVQAHPDIVDALKSGGENLGYLYQIVDDYCDGDADVPSFDFRMAIIKYRQAADMHFSRLPESPFRRSLLAFTASIADLAK